MSKLSLSKRKMNVIDDDADIPCNQEQYQQMLQNISTEEDDFDYSLNLTSEDNTKSGENITRKVDCISTASVNFEKEMDNRHKIACAREGISYGISCGKMPPFMKLNFHCKPDLGDMEMNNAFRDHIDQKCEELRKKFSEDVISYLDSRIEESNARLRRIRQISVFTLGKREHTSDEKEELNQRMKGIKERFDKKLLDFKTEIRSEKSRRQRFPTKMKYGRKQFRGRSHPYKS